MSLSSASPSIPLPVGGSSGHNVPSNPTGNGAHSHQYARDILSSPDAADTCPVCLEPLSFSFRLPGEKPHVVPECGHSLHEACFVAVYAPSGTRNSAQVPRKTNLGVCGVCRKPMKVGEGDAMHGGGSSGKSNKLAALTGMVDRSATTFPGRTSSSTPTGSASSRIVLTGNTATSVGLGNNNNNTLTSYDPNEDDPLDLFPSHGGNGSIRSGSSGHGSHSHVSPFVVAPSITVKPEFSTLTRSTTEPTQPLTCIVTIELPSRRGHSHLPGTVMDDYLQLSNQPHLQGHASDRSDTTIRHTAHAAAHGGHRTSTSSTSTNSTSPPPPTQYAYNATPAPGNTSSNPFATITEDLRNRIIDWKGHPLSGLGPLQMYDLLSVRRDALVREFYVYLFREAIICVVEERKRSIANRILGSGAGNLGDHAYSASAPAGPGKGVLRLKGRIYVRHIKQVTETSVKSELSLTIDMEDERLESFILIFKDRATLEAWRSRIVELFGAFKGRDPIGNGNGTGGRTINNPVGNGIGDFGNGYPPQRVGTVSSISTSDTASTSASASQNDSLLAQGSRSTLASSTSHSQSQSHTTYTQRNANSTGLKHSPSSVSAAHSAGSGASGSGSGGSIASGGEDYNTQTNNALAGHMANMNINMSYSYPSSNFVAPHVSNGPSNSLPPVPHTGFDLILVLSLPPPNSSPSTAALKHRVLKTSLDFVIASLGGRDRLSIVTFEAGMGGRVRRTPFLCPGRPQGVVRLKKFVEGIGASLSMSSPTSPDSGISPSSTNEDEFLIRTPRDEKTDVVTAVNHALDIVLQRKARNPISGMMLVSDSADSTRRAQMDLVLARAEAANVPIHSFGYGRSHDPASLWLMSNHTSGTYTFIKDWYDLRDCLAGCLGGMMSIALTNMKLHMRVVDGRRFRVRKVSGGPACIVSSDGTDVDVDVGELRFGERKEMLVEVELDNAAGIGGGSSMGLYDRNESASPPPPGSSSRPRNATEQFVANMGLDLSDSSFSGAGGNGAMSGSGMGVLGGMDGTASLAEGMMEGMIDELPVFEIDGSFYDPAVAKQVSRLAHPVLLTVTVLPPGSPSSAYGSNGGKNGANGPVDPVIVRRRMELLASDMITRALVLVSRKNVPQAQRILNETKRILHTVLQNITQTLPPPNPHSQSQAQPHRNRKEALTFSAVRTLQSILADISLLSEALSENVDLFAHDQRNFGAQQAMILRDQKSWTGRSATERVFWTAEVASEMVVRSRDWIGRE
ncbi:hypothetical protein Clacol_005379 [Clathrus columnatus]|uniref:RING-type domain-containing protein n=1 Tax=Clathrus columnatus TaxID=1419009 RepID=A0AAV5ACD8_9AGAM|nr:hypothetical protein Clacol_005379 [Clathrus columnatus]